MPGRCLYLPIDGIPGIVARSAVLLRCRSVSAVMETRGCRSMPLCLCRVLFAIRRRRLPAGAFKESTGRRMPPRAKRSRGHNNVKPAPHEAEAPRRPARRRPPAQGTQREPQRGSEPPPPGAEDRTRPQGHRGRGTPERRGRGRAEADRAESGGQNRPEPRRLAQGGGRSRRGGGRL